MSNLTTNPNAEAQASIARFQIFHGAAKGSVLSLKLAKFFAGIEVGNLCDLHAEQYGETRGSDGTAPTQEQWLEDNLNVTARTARRYRTHFLVAAQQAPEVSAKLTDWWKKWKATTDKALAAPVKALTNGKTKKAAPKKAKALALQEVCKLAAAEIDDIVDQPDQWGLHELFEKPLKDVTPPTGGSGSNADASAKLAKFWLEDFARRALNNEFLKLPKVQREALLTTLEETTGKLKDSLKK